MTKKKIKESFTIVLAWINKDRHSATYSQARSVVWLQNGTQDDIERAKVYAARPGYKVFVYPTDEPDPLERGRHDMMNSYLERTG